MARSALALIRTFPNARALVALAGAAGGTVPGDRIIDGVDQMAFLRGEQEKSNREHVIVYVGSDLYGVKWRNYK